MARRPAGDAPIRDPDGQGAGRGGRNASVAAAAAHSAAPNPKAAAGLTNVQRTPATTLEARSPTPLTAFNTPNAVPNRRSSTIELVSEPSTPLTTGFCAPTKSASSATAIHPWPKTPTTHARAKVAYAVASTGTLPMRSASHPAGNDTA